MTVVLSTFLIALTTTVQISRADVNEWWCWDEFECQNDVLSIQEEQDIDCYAYGSCQNAELMFIDEGLNTTGWTIYIECRGLRSCQDATLSVINEPDQAQSAQVYIDITGYLGLAFSPQVTIKSYNQPSFECLGEASCYGIQNVSSSYQISCQGARSCNGMDNVYVNVLEGHGMFALLNSNFYSYTIDSDDTVQVELYGYYSGFNASFYCLEGYTCSVDCGINGCVNFNYYCDDNAVSCTVTCGDGVVCPNGWSSDGIYTGEFDNSYYLSNEFSFSYTNDLIDELFNKVYSDDINYEEMECPNNDVIGDKLGCELNDYVNCAFDGYLGDVNDSICINGGAVVYGSNFNMTGNDDSLYCNGGNSCATSRVNLNYNDVYCRGEYSCGDFFEGDNVIATGAESLNPGSVTNSNKIYCFGSNACEFTEFANVETIYATGYDSLYFGDIISNGNDIDIYLLGYESAYFLELTCSGTDTCTIYGLNDDYGNIFVYSSGVGCDALQTCTINYVLINEDNGISSRGDKLVNVFYNVVLVMFGLIMLL